MLFVKVQIIKYTDAHFPGWVECNLIDANQIEHRFIDKVPIFTAANINAATSLPQPGFIGCVLIETKKREDGREILTIDTEKPWGITSADGRNMFEVFSGQTEFRKDLS
jgi:hypothetical protein